MKLTRRQEEFVSKLIDMTTELHGPIHYSVLAEQLGVSPFTAYDMLCVLEEKGMVTSEYQLAEGKSGPGRAERLFCPAISMDDKKQRFQQKYNGAALDEVSLKQFVLEKIQQGDMPNMDVARELFARIPPQGSGETNYCLEVMSVIALCLRKRAGQKTLLDYLPRILPDGELDYQSQLGLLGGFAFGLLVQHGECDQEWTQMLLVHILQYQAVVQQMTPGESEQLADAILSIFSPLTEDKMPAKAVA
jgi:hypothetical protein